MVSLPQKELGSRLSQVGEQSQSSQLRTPWSHCSGDSVSPLPQEEGQTHRS